MSLPSPSEPLNGGRVLARTFRLFWTEGWRLILLAAFASFCGEGISVLVDPMMQAQVDKIPALNIVSWVAQFPTFVIGDTAVAVAALVSLGGGRPRLTFSFLAALGLLPVCLIVDLVENLPDVIERVVLGTPGPDDARMVVSLLVAAAWNTAWMPALAVAAQEHLGPIATLRRSLDLVRGNWVRTFSFTVMMHVGQQLAPLLIALLLMWITKAAMPGWAFTLIATPFFAFASTSQATLYWELARLRDGVNRSEVDAIFD